jgi:hypothetical protein
MDDLYDYIDDAVVAGTVDLDEDPVAAYVTTRSIITL